MDKKYALSSTSARVVVAGANVIVAAWRKALAIDAQVIILFYLILSQHYLHSWHICNTVGMTLCGYVCVVHESSYVFVCVWCVFVFVSGVCVC